MPANVNQDVCIGCGACVAGCPVGALALNGDGKSECNESACIECGSCVSTCPVGAIEIK